MAKFISAAEAAKLIPDGATVGLAGMGLSGWPEEVACAIRDNFKETGHPCGLNLKQGSAMGDWGYGNNFIGWNRSPREGGPDTEHGNRGATRFGEAGPGLIPCGKRLHTAGSGTEGAAGKLLPAPGCHHQPLAGDRRGPAGAGTRRGSGAEYSGGAVRHRAGGAAALHSAQYRAGQSARHRGVSG